MPVEISTDGIRNVSQFVGAIKKKLPAKLGNIDDDDISVRLSDGITRADSGLDNDKFASDLIEDTILRPGCLLSELGDVGTDDRQPFIVSVIEPVTVQQVGT